MTKPMDSKKYWRSLDERAGSAASLEHKWREFPVDATEIEVPADGVSRRKFLGLMGATAGLAGAVGCRKPVEHIVPFSARPEDRIPGDPVYYATSLYVAGSVQQVLVESQDGRPTKVEGNPRSPVNFGAATTHAQAAVLGVYDPDRSQHARHAGEPASLQDGLAALEAAVAPLRAARGAGLGIVIDDTPSPSLYGLLERVKSELPQAKLYVHSGGQNERADQGAAMVGLAGQKSALSLARATVVLALDSDIAGNDSDGVAAAREFASRRNPEQTDVPMNRLYSVEPTFSLTGMLADNRLQVPASQVGPFLQSLAKYLLDNGATLPPGSISVGPALTPSGDFGAWVATVGDDLLAHRGESVVCVGWRQPAWVHGLAHLVNAALGNVGATVHYVDNTDMPALPGAAELAADIASGTIQTLVVAGSNPAYSAAADLDLGAAIAGLDSSFALGYYHDETSQAAKWHLPQAHQLEAWGDVRSDIGISGLQQPLIQPLYDSVSALELVQRVLSGQAHSGFDIVQSFWRAKAGPAAALGFDAAWRRWVHDGIILELRQQPAQPQWAVAGLVEALASATPAPAPTASSLEVNFALDASVYDGRYANNAWLQELPDPVTKLTWDNAALMSPATWVAIGQGTADNMYANSSYESAEQNGRASSRIATITVNGRTVDIPVFVTPGVAANTVVLPLGYGRTGVGSIADAAGFNTYAVKTSDTQAIAPGATLTWTDQPEYELATTQDHHNMEGRPMVREATLAEYRETPDFVDAAELMAPNRLHSLWPSPHPREGQQWGMVIDLATCNGCNACTIACNAENNIPVVGKERILQGRELHWIRIDRYFAGDDTENPSAVSQPVGCMHCENAPCEQVCPVAATTHGPEGTNDMAYNRCIGTRYCANNCPYKVRRFNYFNFALENDDRNPLYAMQKNPDVTVRFRGVMEKCSFCIQRINGARIDAKVGANGVIQDGALVTACQQTCPTGAIVFGDINDPNSNVSRRKANPRNYGLLTWLNSHPRTSYLGKIRNPNPELV